jgi:hypothetical protein
VSAAKKKQAAGHTPGPWSMDGLRGVWLIAARDVPQVARLTCDPDDAEGTAATEADARLIAAAPELLDALEDAARWINTLPADIRLGSIMLEKLRAAIAKARGAA